MSELPPTAVETIATASDKAIDAATDTVQSAAKAVKAAAAPAPAAKRVRAATKSATSKRSSKRSAGSGAAAAPLAKAARKNDRKAPATVAKRKYVRKAVSATKPAAAAIARATGVKSISPSPKSISQGIKIMDNANNMFAAFTAVPGADKFQNLFAGAGEKSQEVVRKGQAFAESLTETTRANMEAVAESTRIATAGARDLGHEVVAATKGGVEQATAAVKALAEAKSPTEFFQLQSELVRASFDRFVAEGSKLTEQMVKLAGEAAQPLSSRASVNAEKFSELTV